MRVAHIQASDNTIINIDEDADIPNVEGFYKVPVEEIEGEVYVGFRYDPATKTVSFVEALAEPIELTRREKLIAAGFTEAQADAILALG